MDNNGEPIVEAVQDTVSDSTYTAQEIVDGYQAFGQPREVVMAVMKTSGVKEISFADAENMIDSFCKKEVK